MPGVVREALKIEAVLNLSQKQNEFFRTHRGATLSYRSPASEGNEHKIVIQVGTRSFEGSGPSYEDALTMALLTAMAAYYRWHLARKGVLEASVLLADGDEVVGDPPAQHCEA